MVQPAVFIEVRFSDDKVLRAEGDHAKQIWDWLCSCETMAWVHGSRFSGEPMKEVRPAEANALREALKVLADWIDHGRGRIRCLACGHLVGTGDHRDCIVAKAEKALAENEGVR